MPVFCRQRSRTGRTEVKNTGVEGGTRKRHYSGRTRSSKSSSHGDGSSCDAREKRLSLRIHGYSRVRHDGIGGTGPHAACPASYPAPYRKQHSRCLRGRGRPGAGRKAEGRRMGWHRCSTGAPPTGRGTSLPASRPGCHGPRPPAIPWRGESDKQCRRDLAWR